MLAKLFELVAQPYERKARAVPGLLAVIPILTAFISYFGPKDPLLSAVAALFASCGAVYALASLARMLGKKKEEALIKAWGGLPSTIVLRHRDSFLDIVTKTRYHADISKKLGIQLPTPEQEQADPKMADQMYRGATKSLIQLTRGDRGLLFAENVNYGFTRNMYGLKPIGILFSLLGFVLGLLLAHLVSLSPLQFQFDKLGEMRTSGVITTAVSFAMLLLWTFAFSADDVRRIGYVYAERLFEQLAKIPNATGKRKTLTAKSDGPSISSSLER